MTATETQPKVVSRDECLKARLAHLAAEKEFIRKRDELSRQRRELPWGRVEKNYVFEGPNGPETLADLFASRSRKRKWRVRLIATITRSVLARRKRRD